MSVRVLKPQRRPDLIGKAGVLALATGFLSAGCMPDALLIKLVSTDQTLKEREVSRDDPFTSAKIAVIDVDGILLNARLPRLLSEGEHPVSLLAEQLDKAARDAKVKAVILRINSPGGAVTASELMYDEVRHFRRTTGKPVIAVLMDVAASGGYYVACACDEIIAQRTTVTGSIGVIMQFFELEGTMKLVGVTANTITSGPHKDSGSPFKAMRDEERQLFQAMVNDMYDRFVEVVDEGRPGLDREAVLKLADGRVYTAPQALEVGLIDRIGTLREAIDRVKKRVNIRSARVVIYHRPLDYRPTYYARTPGSSDIQVNLLQLNTSSGWWPGIAQFMYLWAPGI